MERVSTFDLEKKKKPLSEKQQRAIARERFERSSALEKSYAVKLRHVARQVGVIINGLAPGGEVKNMAVLRRALEKYSDMLDPWARAIAQRMVNEVAKRNATAWSRAGSDMGLSLKSEILAAPTGEAMRQMMQEQVVLIKSIPIEAAERVQKLAIESLSSGARYGEIVKEIMRSGDVAQSRAVLIARTESGRASTTLTQARADYIGSEGYIWQTARDGDVRPSHRRMQGKFVRWDEPPTLDNLTGHAGALPNCRCFPEVVIPESLLRM